MRHTHPYIHARAKAKLSAFVVTCFTLSVIHSEVATAASSFRPTVFANTEAFLVIDDDDTTADVVMRFGDTLAKTLTFNRLLDRFQFNDDVYTSGSFTASGTLITESGAYIDGNTFVVQANTNRVGIGTAGPDTAFDVVGTISGSLVTQQGAGNNSFMGNVGIGTTAPGKLLTLSRASESASAQLELRNVGGISTGNFDGITFTVGSAGATTLGNIKLNYANDGSTALSFDTRDGVGTVGERVRIDNAGNVGIGTTSPGSPLHVYKDQSRTSLTDASKGLLHLWAGDDYSAGDIAAITFGGGYSGDLPQAVIGQTITDNGGNLFFGTSNTWGAITNTAMFINHAGNVGIGTTAPSTKLTIRSGAKATESPTDSIILGSADASDPLELALRIHGNATAGSRYSSIQSTEQNVAYRALALNPFGGNVGIGTTAPGGKFEVVQGTDDAKGVLVTGSNQIDGISLSKEGDVGRNWIHWSQGSGVADWRIGMQAYDFGIYNAAGGAATASSPGTAYLTIQQTTGNVGIGTTEPAGKLDIVDSAATYNAESGGLRIRNNSTSPGKFLQLGYDAAIDASFIRSVHSSTGFKPLLINPEGGNVGIGTTSPGAKLQIGSASARGFRVYGNTSPYGVAIAGDTGGWAYGYNFEGNAGTALGGFGAYGSDDALTNYYIGTYGNQRVTVLSSGNVGIGTTAPGSLFTVNQAAHTTDGSQDTYGIRLDNQGVSNITLGSDASYAYLQSWASKPLKINSQGNNTLLNPTSGNVGIGTTSPSYKFHVVSGDTTVGAVRGDGAAIAQFLVGNTAGDTAIRTLASGDAFIFPDTGKYLAFGANGASEKMRIDTAGNVGIGTTNPGAKLEVNGNVIIGSESVTEGLSQRLTVAADNSNWGLAAGFVTDSVGRGVAVYSPDFDDVSTGERLTMNIGDGYAVMQAAKNGASANGDFILQPSGGNVGIGTTSPLSRLQVQGGFLAGQNNTTDAANAFGAVGTAGLSIIDGGAEGHYRGGSLGFGGLSTGLTSPYLWSVIKGGKENATAGNYAGYLGLWTTAGGSTSAEHMRITSTGNVGIGTTAPDTKLDVRGSLLTYNGALPHYQSVASYNNATNNVTGTMKITLPKYGSNTMMQVKISGYDYSTAGAWEVLIGGYNYEDHTWYNTSATLKGRAPFTSVRLANDDVNDLILLGTTSTVWQYPAIEVGTFIAGYSGITGWGAGWSIAAITSETGINDIVTPTIDIYTSATGNVGIGTTSPGTKLHISDTSANAPNILVENTSTFGIRLGLDNSNVGYMGSTNGTPVAIRTNGANRIYVDTAGLVGIGTSSPTAEYKMDIAGTNFRQLLVRESGTTNQAGGIEVQNDTGKYLVFEVAGSTSGMSGLAQNDAIVYAKNNLQFGTNGDRTPVMFLSTAGNVGIGTISPTSKLSVSGAVTIGMTGVTPLGNLNTFFGGAAGNGTNSDGVKTVGSWVHSYLGTPDTNDTALLVTGYANNANARLLDVRYGDTTSNGGGTSAFVVRQDGQVGIGTTAPATKLDVVGTISGSLLTISGKSAANKSLCIKSTGVVGVCSSVVDSSGGCTCN